METFFTFTESGAIKSWGLYFQDTANPQMEALVELHDNIMFYLVIILFGVAWIILSIIRNYAINKSCFFKEDNEKLTLCTSLMAFMFFETIIFILLTDNIEEFVQEFNTQYTQHDIDVNSINLYADQSGSYLPPSGSGGGGSSSNPLGDGDDDDIEKYTSLSGQDDLVGSSSDPQGRKRTGSEAELDMPSGSKRVELDNDVSNIVPSSAGVDTDVPMDDRDLSAISQSGSGLPNPNPDLPVPNPDLPVPNPDLPVHNPVPSVPSSDLPVPSAPSGDRSQSFLQNLLPYDEFDGTTLDNTNGILVANETHGEAAEYFQVKDASIRSHYDRAINSARSEGASQSDISNLISTRDHLLSGLAQQRLDVEEDLVSSEVPSSASDTSGEGAEEGDSPAPASPSETGDVEVSSASSSSSELYNSD
jgi:hypothetical protein